MSEERFVAIETKLDRLSGQMEALDGRVADLDHQMRVLHEDTIANIKALAPDFAPIRREFQAADAKLKGEVDERLTPLEALARRQRDK